jgi:cation transport ATPase
MSDEHRQQRLDEISERIARWHLIVVVALAFFAIAFWLLMAP